MPATYVPGPNGPIVLAFASGAAATTWDPANKSSKITLSGGDLVATQNSTGVAGVRSVANHSTGKYYMECTLTTKTGGADDDGVGVVNASFTLGGSYVGSTNNGAAVYDGGSVYRSSGVVATIASFATGNVVCMAIDTTARLAWWRTNGGNWNNNGAADPATGANGIDISVVTGALYAAVEADTVNAVWTANFGATAYAQAVPSGYGNW